MIDYYYYYYYVKIKIKLMREGVSFWYATIGYGDLGRRISYVGMIIVGRAEQPSKALFDIATREVGRITLTRS